MNITLISAFGAGLLTFLSPCVLPLAPVFIASLVVNESQGRWGKLAGTLWFSLGFATVFTVLGMGVAQIQEVAGPIQPILLAVAGVFLLAFAGKLMGWWSGNGIDQFFAKKLNFRSHDQLINKLPKGPIRSVIFGAAFATTWTPCVGPVLGGVLTYVATQKATSFEGASLLLSFSLGIAVPLLILSAFSEKLTPLIQKLKKKLPQMEYVTGFALALFAAYVLSQAFHQRDRILVNSSTMPQMMVTLPSGNQVPVGDPARNQVQMLFFHSDSCPICKMMESYLPAFEKECQGQGFEFVRVNVGYRENSEISERFGVRAVPTIAVLDGQGKEVIRLVGYQTEARLREAVERMTPVTCAQHDAQLKGGGDRATILRRHSRSP